MSDFHETHVCVSCGALVQPAAPAEGLDVERLVEAAREVVRYYGTDRTWSLMFRALLGSRIDDLAAALTPEDDR